MTTDTAVGRRGGRAVGVWVGVGVEVGRGVKVGLGVHVGVCVHVGGGVMVVLRVGRWVIDGPNVCVFVGVPLDVGTTWTVGEFVPFMACTNCVAIMAINTSRVEHKTMSRIDCSFAISELLTFPKLFD
jgi:hypothetical protein